MKNRRKKTRYDHKIEKEKSSITRQIIKNREIITLILAILAAVYPISNTIYCILYQAECEIFYGVPGKYFVSNINNRLVYFGSVILLLIICIIPALMKKQDEKSEKSSKAYMIQTFLLTIVIGGEIGLFNVYNLIEIMKQAHKTNAFFDVINEWLDKNACFTIIISIILGLISVIGITLIKQIRKIKYNWIKKVISGIWCFSALVSLMILIYGTIFKLSISIEDKTKYEFVTIDSSEYVVLTSYKDKILIVPFEITDNEAYIFYTNQYMFIDTFTGKYQYIDIGYSPCIYNENKK